MEHIYDLIIVGSGPAGLSAVVYAQRSKLDTIVIEKVPMSGGQILNTYEVDNYLGMPNMNGFDMGMKFREHADNLGATFLNAEVKEIIDEGDVKTVVTTKENYKTRTVLITSGAESRKLGLENEKRLAGAGVSYCATCDGAFFRNKATMVVGGGDVAVEDAIFLSRLCEKVYVVHRRDEFRAAKIYSDKLKTLENVEIIWDSVLEEINGDSQVSNAIVKNVKTEEKREIDVDGIFIAVGMIPNTKEYEGLIKLDSSKYIVANEDGITSVPGIFVAGDARTKELRQIVTAVSDGANAITSIERYLNAL